MQTLAIYRRLLSQGLIARDQAQRDQKETARVAKMFFLLRMAFWLGLVLVLLPREKAPESEKLPQIGASQAVQAATAAVSDMTQFCKRQPAACTACDAPICGSFSDSGVFSLGSSTSTSPSQNAMRSRKNIFATLAVSF